MKKNLINTPVKDFTSVDVEDRKKLNIKAGDTIKVSVKIIEKNAKGKERVRIQIFEGLVLSRKHGNEPGAMITVRKVSAGVGVERIFPVFSPIIDKIEVVKRGKVRRSKLYFIREKVNKEIRRQMRRAKQVALSSLSGIAETARIAEEEKKAEEEKAKQEAEVKAKQEAEAKAKEAEAQAEEQKNDETPKEDPEEKPKEDTEEKKD